MYAMEAIEILRDGSYHCDLLMAEPPTQDDLHTAFDRLGSMYASGQPDWTDLGVFRFCVRLAADGQTCAGLNNDRWNPSEYQAILCSLSAESKRPLHLFKLRVLHNIRLRLWEKFVGNGPHHRWVLHAFRHPGILYEFHSSTWRRDSRIHRVLAMDPSCKSTLTNTCLD